jgi:hypothetical protein
MNRLSAIAAAAAVTALLGVASSGSAATEDPALARSAALVAAPAGDPFAAEASIPAATARVIADEVGRRVPLPDGGTFSGVRWEEAGGLFSRTEITAVLQYNASCQWLRAWRDRRQPGVTARVLADVPSWPAWRGAETQQVLSRIVSDVRAGGGEIATASLADCDASHAREVAFAKSRGLPPSR